MKYMTKLTALLALMALIVPLVSVPAEVSADDSGYEIREIETFRPDSDESTMEAYRVYSSMPNVPFITLDGLFNLYSTEVMETTFSEGKVTYTNPITLSTATIDTKELVFTCDSYFLFRIPSYGEDVDPRYITATAETVHEEMTKTIAIGEYGIPMYADGDNVWMPIQTASDLLMGTHTTYTFCIPDLVCCIKLTEILGVDQLPDKLIEVLRAEATALSTGTVRDSTLADLTYRELCLAIDNNYGKPEKAILGKELRQSKLDDVLNNHSESTKKIAQWLKSDQYVEYEAGLVALAAYLNDGGHTGFLWLPSLIGNRMAEVNRLLETIDVPDNKDVSPIREELKKVRSDVLGSKDYSEHGDTAIFTFNEFVDDLEGWEEFYDKGGEIPDDTYGSVIKALNRAKENPEIKNFIFDITTNTGGQTSACMAILSLMTGDYSYKYTSFVDTGWSYVMKCHIDTNLDGKFDEKDLMKQYDFNFGILCTQVSFSCGNLLPVYAKEYGIMILGETSGGGCCAVTFSGTADGVVGALSTTVELSDSKGRSVESGATPDVVLVDTDSETADLSALYDMETLSKEMNAFYSDDGDDGVVMITVAIVVIGVLILVGVLVLREN